MTSSAPPILDSQIPSLGDALERDSALKATGKRKDRNEPPEGERSQKRKATKVAQESIQQAAENSQSFDDVPPPFGLDKQPVRNPFSLDRDQLASLSQHSLSY